MSDIEGLKELSDQLNRLGADLGAKTLRQATMGATLPAFNAIKAAAPVGSQAHRTYKGNLVAPGFLKRSIKRKSYISRKKGSAVVLIGARREAFYGINFLDSGTKYIAASYWFRNAFISRRSQMESRLKQLLVKKINRAIKR